jgi:PKD repeat protein
VLALWVILAGALLVAPAGQAAAASGVDLSCTDSSGGAVYQTDTGLEVAESAAGIAFGTFPTDESVRFGGGAVRLSASGSARVELDRGTGNETCLSDVRAGTVPVTVESAGELDVVLQSNLSAFAYRDPDYAADTGADVAYDAGNSVAVRFASTGEPDGTTVYAVDGRSGALLDRSGVAGSDVTLTLPSGSHDVDLRTNSLPTSSDTTVDTDADTVHVFSTSDFRFSDSDGDSLQQVRITSLPDNGTLRLDTNGTDGNEDGNLSVGDTVPAGEIASGTLRYAPPPDRTGEGLASFGFRVKDPFAFAERSSTMTVDVRPVDDVLTAEAGGNTTVDEDTAVAFDASASTDDAGIVGYEWAFGDGTTGTGETVEHTYDTPGTYTATLTVEAADGSTATDTRTVTVRDTTAPTVTFGDQTVANGSETVTVATASYRLANGTAGEYVVVAHRVETGSLGGPVGTSGTLSGSAANVTVDLNASGTRNDGLDVLTENTTLRAVLHSPGESTAFGPVLRANGSTVGDSATVTVADDENDQQPAGPVRLSNVSLGPAVVEANATTDHALTFEVLNVSADGEADAFAVTVSDGTFESVTGVSVVDTSGADVPLSGGPDVNGAEMTFGVAPEGNATVRDLTVTANVTIAVPDVTNATGAELTITVADSTAGGNSATVTLTVRPAEEGEPANPALNLVEADGTVGFTEVLGVVEAFNGDGTYTQDGETVAVGFRDALGVVEAFNERR